MFAYVLDAVSKKNSGFRGENDQKPVISCALSFQLTLLESQDFLN